MKSSDEATPEASAALSGRTLSHYQILERIGSGGMGIVYKAFDTRLKRPVALKVLPPDRVADPERKRRFMKEARAASALNHPNIVTIHDIDQAEGVDFIAMEYLAGTTLEQHIPDAGIGITDALEFGIQIADGLAAAHSAGIVHRDLKPSNVMVGSGGQLKILDFGLAQVSRSRQPEQLSASSTTTELDTPGMVMGTAPYMSPEAAQGKPTARSTDVWSWGCLLYECLTGQRAFPGKTAGEALIHVLTSEPNWSCLPRELPKEVRGVLQSCLDKDATRRLQDIGDARRELGKALVQLNHPRVQRKFGSRVNARMGYALVAGLLLVAVAAWFLLKRDSDPLPRVTDAVQLTKTLPWEAHPAFSPDGKRLAYSSNASGDAEIYIREIGGGDPIQITRDPGSDDDPEWSADGAGLFFSSDRDGSRSIWKTDLQGHEPRMVTRNARYPAVSPDGRWIAMSREVTSGLQRIAVAPIDNPSQTKYLTGEGEGVGNHVNPTWSPDGQQLCYSDNQDLWIVSTQGGGARRITHGAWVQSDPAWAPDGRHIYFSSYPGTVLAIWRVRRDGSGLTRVTFGTGPIGQPCLSRDGRRMVCSSHIINPRLIIQDLTAGGERSLSDCNLDIFASLASDLSRVVFVCAHRSPGIQLWSRSLSKGRPVGQAVPISGVHGPISHPALSPDGRWIAYYTVGESADIFIVPIGGGSPVRATKSPARDMYPAWSPDGSLLAFCSEREATPEIWLVPISKGRPAGEERRLTDLGTSALYPWFSPDGKQVAFVRKTPDEVDVWVVPVDGAGKARQLTTGARVKRVRWLANGSLAVTGLWGETGVSLRIVSPSGGALRPFPQPVDFGPGSEAWGIFDISTDGSLIAYSRREDLGDLWLLESSRGSF